MIYFSDFSDFDHLFSNFLFSDFLIFDYLLSPFLYFIHSVSLLYYFNIVLFYLFLLDYQNVCFYIHLIPFYLLFFVCYISILGVLLFNSFVLLNQVNRAIEENSDRTLSIFLFSNILG